MNIDEQAGGHARAVVRNGAADPCLVWLWRWKYQAAPWPPFVAESMDARSSPLVGVPRHRYVRFVARAVHQGE